MIYEINSTNFNPVIFFGWQNTHLDNLFMGKYRKLLVLFFLSIKISILSCYVSVEEQTILIYAYFFPLKVHLNGQIFLSSSLQTLPFFLFQAQI